MKEVVLQKNTQNDRRILVGKPFEHPWRLTGYLESSTPQANFVGSGFLVGKRCVLTAGHCLYAEGIGINHARFFLGDMEVSSYGNPYIQKFLFIQNGIKNKMITTI